MRFAYDDIWYYNNYHVLGRVFVFPHYMKVTFIDSSTFKKLEYEGVDFDWYKNDDQARSMNTTNSTFDQNKNYSFYKKFVILRDSNLICFDSGEGRI